MKNKLWRFGDSWSTTKDSYEHLEFNHSQYVADYFDMDLMHFGHGGFSNLEIFKRILEHTHEYKQNDIILINFTSIHRIAVIDGSETICTANGDDTAFKSKKLMKVVSNDVGDVISDVIFYLIKSHLESLMNMGVRVYYFYNDVSNSECPIKIKNKLIFRSKQSTGFIGWCKENDYEDLSPAGNVHYKLGCQKDIANKIIELIESL